MRHLILLAALSLAACDSPEPPISQQLPNFDEFEGFFLDTGSLRADSVAVDFAESPPPLREVFFSLVFFLSTRRSPPVVSSALSVNSSLSRTVAAP